MCGWPRRLRRVTKCCNFPMMLSRNVSGPARHHAGSQPGRSGWRCSRRRPGPIRCAAVRSPPAPRPRPVSRRHPNTSDLGSRRRKYYVAQRAAEATRTGPDQPARRGTPPPISSFAGWPTTSKEKMGRRAGTCLAGRFSSEPSSGHSQFRLSPFSAGRRTLGEVGRSVRWSQACLESFSCYSNSC
jgi:hypothetical protein